MPEYRLLHDLCVAWSRNYETNARHSNIILLYMTWSLSILWNTRTSAVHSCMPTTSQCIGNISHEWPEGRKKIDRRRQHRRHTHEIQRTTRSVYAAGMPIRKKIVCVYVYARCTCFRYNNEYVLNRSSQMHLLITCTHVYNEVNTHTNMNTYNWSMMLFYWI